jgi:N-acetylglutamate synthase-like GNAT family acetyltransferase
MKAPGIEITAARLDDGPAIAALLREAGLPHEDIDPHIGYFLVAREAGGALVGAIGAEVHAPDALLRSLIVAPSQRAKGLGGELVRRLEAAAAAWGVQRWWLLTTTAESFFGVHGFVVADRAGAPAGIRGTRQFSGGCSAGAVCLTRERRRGP